MYEYDVFISYKHAPRTTEWVQDYLFQELHIRLPDEVPVEHEAKIFIDTQIRVGDAWDLALQMALKKSKLLIPIFSPDYFRSNICLNELHTFLEREKILNYRTNENPGGLILPVLYADGRHIPADFLSIQNTDVRDYAHVGNAFKSTPLYHEFQVKMKRFAINIAEALNSVPDYDENWPVIELTEKIKPTKASKPTL